MAPRKRATVEPTTMVTRSSTRPKTQLKPESSPPKKKAKKAQKKSEPKAEEKAPEVAAEDGVQGKKTIIIEHCKQCNSFKTRALQVKKGLEEGGIDGGVSVILNPEKPRRGCFEIREEGENGEKFVSLLEMKRPFGPMKALDMDQVIADIIEKIK